MTRESSSPASANPGQSVEQLSAIPSAGPVHTEDTMEWFTAADESRAGLAGNGLEERFEILGKIGEGGMGKVLLAKDQILRRVVALKQLRTELVGRRDAVERFRREAQIVAQLEHPSIVPIYAAERRRDGLPTYSMKYVRGITLEAYIERCVRVCKRRENPNAEHALTSRLEMFAKLCEAISYAHSRGVIHRDLKPENVMIGAFGEVYVMDWGIARLVEHDEEDGPVGVTAQDDLSVSSNASPVGTTFGTVIGTLTHMPPEQAKGEIDHIGPASDQFALGMVLFELVTLRPPRPFEGDVARVRAQALRGDREAIVHRYQRRVAKPLAAVIATATAPEIGRRYTSVAELQADVRRFIRGDEVSVRRDSPLQRAGRFMARYPALILSTVLMFMVVAGFVVVESLLEAVEAQQRAQRQSEEIAELTRYVVEAARDVDIRGHRLQAMLEGLAAEALARLESPTSDPDLASVGEEDIRLGAPVGLMVHADALESGDPPPAAYDSDRYRRPVSFDNPSYWLADSGDAESAARALRRLQPLRDRFREMTVRAMGQGFENVPQDLQSETLRDESSFLEFSYLGLANGLMIMYPGIGGFPPDYDPRARPWYTRMLEEFKSSFGDPYPEVTGLGAELSCNIPIRAADGRLLAVAGTSIRLSDFAEMLDMDRVYTGTPGRPPRPPLPGWRNTALVDRLGHVVVDSATEQADLGGGTHGNRTLESLPYPSPELVEQVVAGRTSGLLTLPEEIIVYQRMTEIGWYVVVRVDRSLYVGDRVAPTRAR